MSTFLSLCEDLARESGAFGAAPATVVGPLPRRQAQCVGWIRGAWTSIQNSKADWRFLRAEFAATLTPGKASYTPAELGATRFAEWGRQIDRRPIVSVYDPAIGRKDENWLHQLPYEGWRQSFDFGVHNLARPTYWATGLDESLKFGATPDKAYMVRGEYRMTPQVLAADNDVPAMPERFHAAIVYRAIMLMAESDEAVTALQTAQLEFGVLYSQMVRDLLPEVTTAGSPPIDRR